MNEAASDAAPFALMRVDKAAVPTSVLLRHQPRLTRNRAMKRLSK